MRVFATVLLLALGSCTPKATPAGVAAFAPLQWSALTGAPYRLTGLTLKGKATPLPDTRRPTIQFGDNGAVSGMAGVNRYSTGATVSGKDTLAWTGPIAATKMAGPPEAMALESAFLGALEAATRISLRDGKLTLASADDATRLEFGQ